MAVKIALTDTDLSNATGFKPALGSNLGMFSTTELSLSSTRTIAFTPSAAEPLNGVILCLSTSSAVSTMKSVTVTLKEGVTTRATVTYTAAQIANSATSGDGRWIVYFTGGTFPYTVTTAASTWTIEVTNATGTNNWSLRTSDGTNLFYIAVGDTAGAYVDNTDVPVAVGKITIDQNATFKGASVTGDATRSVCAIACRSATPTPDAVGQFLWKFNTAQYTVNIDGLFVLSTHAGFRVGQAVKFTTALSAGATSATLTSNWTSTTGSYTLFLSTGEIVTATLTNGATTCTWSGGIASAATVYGGVGQPIANSGTLNIIRATTGTATISGFSDASHTGANVRSRSTYQFWGEVPAVEDAVIQTDATTGQAHVITTTNTGWVNGDTVFIGGQNTKGTGVFTYHTVSSVTTNDITLTSNLATNTRVAGGHIVRVNGYGFKLSGSTTSTGVLTQSVNTLSNFYIGGCQVEYAGFVAGGSGVSGEDAANRSTFIVSHSSFRNLAGLSFTTIINMPPIEEAFYFVHANFTTVHPWGGSIGGSNNPDIRWTDCLFLTMGVANTSAIAPSTSQTPIWTRCSFENGNNSHITMQGVDAQVIDTTFYGNSSSIGAIRFNNTLNYTGSGNTFKNNTTAINFGSITTGKETNSTFTSNTTDATAATGSYFDFELASPTGSITTSGLQYSATNIILNGSIFRISDFNDTSNDDRGILPYGNYQRTGTSLSDTTVRTSPGFAMRIAPISGTNLVNWPNRAEERNVPTGNIQNLPMAVLGWVYINNTAYDAGTYVLPTLNVKYDNATTVSATATATFGSWQLLSVPFTPTTTYGQIQVWFSGATDATGSNAYFYIDDVSVLYPAGVNLNLGKLDLWANAVPVWPPIATVYPAGSHWDEQTSAHTAAGSFGKLVSKTLTVAKFIGLK